MERVYKALEYFKSEEIEFDEQKHNEIIYDRGKAALSRIKLGKMKDFQMWFRK